MASTPWYDGPIWQGFLWTPQNPAGHSGVDIGMPLGTPLTALLPGTVISLGMEPWAGQINLQSDYPGIGSIVISYLHEGSFARGMAPGVHVEPGDLIGYSGQPPPGGRYGSGAHCHFEINTGFQPPYMGHQGPPSPINPMFLIQAAKNGTLGDVATGGAGATALAASATAPSTDAGVVQNLASWLGLPSFSLGTGQVSRAPLSPGILRVVEEFDEVEEIIPFDGDNVLGWGASTFEALAMRATIMLFGFLIVLICIFNAMKPVFEAETQIAGAVLTSAAGAAL
jgi:murein DD-endopeptidase MepM/ murein hydrolase activator NlpD